MNQKNKKMIWYEVDLDIFLFGKETDYIQACNQEEAEIIALKRASNKFKCSVNQIEVLCCKKKAI